MKLIQMYMFTIYLKKIKYEQFRLIWPRAVLHKRREMIFSNGSVFRSDLTKA